MNRSLVIAALLAVPGTALAQETWAGHQVVVGHRDVPFIGGMDFRTDSFVIARVTRLEQHILLEQTPCQVRFPEALGVKVAMKPEVLKKLPPAEVRFDLLGRDKARSDLWFVGWGGEDVDGDEQPGVTINVEAPLCGGDLYVANGATSQATARLTKDGMVGDVSVHVQQEILGASNFCLSWFSSAADERQQGTFAYKRVEDGATCESLGAEPWPIRAPSADLSLTDTVQPAVAAKR